MRTMRWLAVALIGAGLVTACKDSKGPGGSGGPSNLAPDAKFSFDCAALRCDFRDASTDDVRVASWSWSFGDAAASIEPSPVHDYGSAGAYTVSLTVTDEEGETNTQTKQVQATEPLVTSLSCENPAVPGQFVHCTLKLEADAGFEVVLNSTSCTAHGNIFRITTPVQGILTSDGCYEQDGKTLSFAGPFPSGTEISAEVEAPLLQGAPGLHVTGQYPVWNLTFEDGEDADFNDLVMTLRALP
jgi:PKD repeat protein